MLIRPPPMPPCPFLYSPGEFAKHQTAYLKDVEAHGRECNRVMWMNVIPVVCACIGLSIAALMGPSIMLDAISILVR